MIEQGKAGVAAGNIKYPVVFRGLSGNPIVTTWHPLLLSFGGDFFDDKWNIIFNSEAGKAAADFFVDHPQAERASRSGRVRKRSAGRGHARRRLRRDHPIYGQRPDVG